MKQLEVRADKIVIKGHYSNLVSGVILLSAGSFPLIDFVLPMILDVDLFSPDGMPVLCLVAILLFFFGVGLFMLLRFFETVTVDGNGILRKGLLKTKS